MGVAACQILGGLFHRKKAPAASWLAATGLVKSWVAIFTKKKAPAARYIAATGLVKSWVVIFTEKSACGKLISSNRARQILGGHFHQKSACRKLDSSSWACQVRSVPCQVGSVSCRVKPGPCQPPSVSCFVKPHPCQSAPCPLRSLRVSVSVSCRRHPAKATSQVADTLDFPSLEHRKAHS